MDNYAIFQLVTVWAILATGAFLLIIYWNPYAIRIALSKRLVWICDSDGDFVPVKATLEGGAYKTKDHGIFEFGREDVMIHARKPCIIAYGPYSKSLRLHAVPVLQKLKSMGIDRYDMLMGILGAEVLSEQEFEDLQKKQSEGA